MAEGRFQVAAGAVIQHVDTGNVLLIHRSSSQYAGDIWEIPIGRIEQFETFEIGLRREVAEETGISDLEIGRPISTFEFMRGKRAAKNEVRAVVFAARTGQAKVKLSHEHDAYQWLPIAEAIDFVVQPGIKRDLITFRSLTR